jgi:hypothetical protein
MGKMQWFMPFIGFDWRYPNRYGINEQERNICLGQSDTKDTRKAVFSLGFMYVLPMLGSTWSGRGMFTDGRVRLSSWRRMDIACLQNGFA